jgi:transposase-like protein
MSINEENTTPSTTSNGTSDNGVPNSSTTNSQELALFQLDPQKQRFIQLYMTGNFTIAKIAQLMEIHPNTASNWLKREDVKNAIVEAQGEIHQQVQMQITANTMKAVQRLNDLMDSSIDAVSLQAVKDVLDRGGHKPKNEIKVDKTVTTIEQKFREIIDMAIPDEVLEAELVEDGKDE